MRKAYIIGRVIFCMPGWKPYVPAVCIGLQALLNVPFYGIPAILFVAILPASLVGRFPPLLPILILGYFSLGVLHIYYSGVSFDPGRARLFGYFYFSIGLLSPLAVIFSPLWTGDYETPLLFVVMGLWALLSLVGMAGLKKWAGELEGLVSIALMFLTVFSAVISASTAAW